MKIDNAGKVVPSYTGSVKSTGRSAKASSSASSAPPANVDENVELTPAASQMSEPPFDAAKVEAIKQAISAGQFRINPEAIADGLINTARELAGG
jgi:negative regulator of flagellin synthesis FlgM